MQQSRPKHPRCMKCPFTVFHVSSVVMACKMQWRICTYLSRLVQLGRIGKFPSSLAMIRFECYLA